MENELRVIKTIWRKNLEFEFSQIESMLLSHNFIAVDTEFPGFLRNTLRGACESQRYEDLKFNVNHLKLIQLGLTLFNDKGNFGGTWQINFCDFDVDVDPLRCKVSKRFDFEKNRKEGVDSAVFGEKFKRMLLSHKGIKWVTFHGLYDLGYLIRLQIRTEIPNSLMEFADMAWTLFGGVYDVKFMAKYYHVIVNNVDFIGLERLSNILNVKRVGEAHLAGSDSLLTAAVFLKMVRVSCLIIPNFEGLMYGISVKMQCWWSYYQGPILYSPPLLIAAPPQMPTFFAEPTPCYMALLQRSSPRAERNLGLEFWREELNVDWGEMEMAEKQEIEL